jgi:uncharacterized protein (TIGR02646 family)
LKWSRYNKGASVIEIKKREEPKELVEYRRMPNASYQDMHGAVIKGKNVYDVVLDNLINEQGRLCAYCMKRIPEGKTKHGASIEHIEPQSLTGEKSRLGYRNMLAVCIGNRNSQMNDMKTCDAKRGTLSTEKQKLYVNPLDANTLKTIKYNSNGIIFSEDKNIDESLNEVLNLNGVKTGLVSSRMNALKTLQTEIDKKYHGRDVPDSYLVSLLNKFQQENENKTPYVGILIYWLQKKVKKLKCNTQQ